MQDSTSILLIYTGGTIGMKQDPVSFDLRPFDFSQILEEMPELKKFGYRIDTYSFDPVIDSSDVDIDFWIRLTRLIEENYSRYDGFVVLHGTDTMSFSASALSFMLENIEKPVIFTGSQLPIGMLRTDGKENLISSIEIAASKDKDGHPMVPEVCIYFESQLYRGNRTTKYTAENFRAFRSANYPVLAEAGIHIRFNTAFIRYPEQWGKPLKATYRLDPSVLIIKVTPGMRQDILQSLTDTPGIRAIILETYGSGNAPSGKWFTDCIKHAVDRGVIVLNITQCLAGRVDMDAYSTGKSLKKIGVTGGGDCTTEAAVTKLFFLLGQYSDNETIVNLLKKNIRGELTEV
ncbi:MAG TPA: type I asparaginase [Candidatus Coprenecus stercoravium]|uniref:asparaginase n=1 Tax=Candidatus Coprenecus stercoravium TaxID=2840735 RepID=A0A9D2K9D5_9BACT|nr:type I asparaginase [Candidatus Coprenecus stercoravium]